MRGFLSSIFGFKKKSDKPFDEDKAFHYTRMGVIAGGSFYFKFTPEDVVEYYSYVRPIPDNECGMRDRGADIYFVGLKEGRVEVTGVYTYPTCDPDMYTFTLNVDKDLVVSLCD